MEEASLLKIIFIDLRVYLLSHSMWTVKITYNTITYKQCAVLI